MDTQHRTHQALQAHPPVPPASSTKFVYDGRYYGGWVLVGVGLLIAVLSVLFAVQENIDSDSIFDDVPDYSSAVAGGGVAGFLILLGVILIAGAQIVGTETKQPRHR